MDVTDLWRDLPHHYRVSNVACPLPYRNVIPVDSNERIAMALPFHARLLSQGPSLVRAALGSLIWQEEYANIPERELPWLAHAKHAINAISSAQHCKWPQECKPTILTLKDLHLISARIDGVAEVA